jgi:GntR family transcriptional repressor for pyruvate dehydrogenase complex
MFKSIDRLSVVDQVRGQILAFLWGNLKPNLRLPSERELAETMGVSRSAIREVLQGLVMEGVLGTKQGGGYFVRDMGPSTLLESSAFSFFFGNPKLGELEEARALLEVAMAELAASRATKSETREMEHLVQETERLVAAYPHDNGKLFRLGWAFHGSIASACHNPVIHKLHGVITLIAERTHQSLGADAQYPYSNDAKAHRELWQLIAEGDAAAAGRVMAEHLKQTYRLLETSSAAAPDTEAKGHEVGVNVDGRFGGYRTPELPHSPSPRSEPSG